MSRDAISLTFLPGSEEETAGMMDRSSLIPCENPYEGEITRLTQRIPLTNAARNFFYTEIEVALQSDMYWNYTISEQGFRDKVKLISHKIIFCIAVLSGIVCLIFMVLMIVAIGMNGFLYTTPMFLILVVSLMMKFMLIIRLDTSTRLLFMTNREVKFINVMTLLYIVITAIPYDYFISTDSREDSNHNHHSIWRQKMVFISFTAIASYFLVTYIVVWLSSLMKERKMFRQNFYIIYDGETVRRPVLKEPTDVLLSNFFVIIQSFMIVYEIAVVIDVFLVAAFLSLLVFTFFRDNTVGPVDTSVAFIMMYQFLIPFLEFCEINRIDQQISRQFTFRNLGGSRYNNLTIYEINILVGVLASLVGVMVKIFGFN